jgi:hypothetical protein
MAYVYEINGQKVEFETEPTEADIDEAARSMNPVGEKSAGGAAAQMAAPAVAGYGTGPTGYSSQAVKQVVEPLKAAIPQTLQTYKAAPYKAGVDMVVGSMGLPPPYVTVEGAKGVAQGYQAGKESLSEAGRLASQFVDKADIGKYQDLWSAVKRADPGTEKIISNIYHNQGGGNAVKNWLTTTPEGKKFLADPKTAQIAEQYIGALPGKGAQAMKVIGPVLKGAAKVAGPAGMAYNIYEAAPYLEQAGPELTSGRAQNRMAAAQQSMLNAPTPAPLNATEASNLLASGDERTISIYGGRARLNEIVRSGIRNQAAQRVLGPVAPGSF